MAQSTPLSQLPPISGGGNDSFNIDMNQPQNLPNPAIDMGNSLVDDIIADMEPVPEMPDGDINNGMLDRSMDRSQIPMEKQFERIIDRNDDYSNNMDQSSSMVLDAVGVSGSSMVGKTYNALKLPIAVFLICFIISLPAINRIIFGILPTLLLESGQVSIHGVALKAFIGMILFYILSLLL